MTRFIMPLAVLNFLRDYTEMDSDSDGSESDTADLKAQKKQEMSDWFVGEGEDEARMG